MLNIDTLKQMLQVPFEEYLPKALETAMKSTFPMKSDEGDAMAEKFANAVKDICAEPIAQALAGAIDYYVRSISIYGTVVTVGNMVTQTATIASPLAATNGTLPNTLGIN